MFYPLAGVRHQSYVSDSKLFPVPTDRNLLIVLTVAAIAAPFLLSSFYLNS